MQKQSTNIKELIRHQKWCSQVVLCVLFALFSTVSYASPGHNSEKHLATQLTPDSVCILKLSSSISETQSEEPELDKAVSTVSQAFQQLPAILTQTQNTQRSAARKWNWHLVRGPPVHL